jgi:(2Fe-2S) ferredoxin
MQTYSIDTLHNGAAITLEMVLETFEDEDGPNFNIYLDSVWYEGTDVSGLFDRAQLVAFEMEGDACVRECMFEGVSEFNPDRDAHRLGD